MTHRLLHTMLRVLDLDRSLRFYAQRLGMRALRRTDHPSGRFTNAFVGYDTEERGTVLELTWNWDRAEPYDKGAAYGHIAVGVVDLHGVCGTLRAAGVPIVRAPGPLADSAREIAFIEDPDGHRIELIGLSRDGIPAIPSDAKDVHHERV